jgi:4-amino-4-deoxy-L-arabinose transferase-like glycosyltransferase
LRTSTRTLEWLGLAVLTAAALGLRLRGIAEGLYHDELYTYAEVHGRSFGGMLDVLVHGIPGGATERTPPLYFALAWLSSKLGSPDTTIRLPSILLGTATVPLVFLVGRRTVGHGAALFGAAFVALSPFAIFYAIEARAYGTLMFLSALSALVLLKAVETDRPAWWAGWTLVAAAVMYTHYTGALVLGLEGAWVLWFNRERWRSLALASVGAAVLFAAWLPHFKSVGADYKGLAGILGIHDGSAFLQWLAGSPDEHPATLPGTFPLVMLAVAAGLAALGVALARSLPRVSSGAALVLLLGVGPPLVLLVYAQVGEDLFVYPRNMSAAIPFAGLALGWLLTRPALPFAAAAAAVAIVALAIGAGMTLQDRFHRPNSPEVARELDARLGHGGAVVYYGPGLDPLIIGHLLEIYLREPHRIVGATETEQSLRQGLVSAGKAGDPALVVAFDYGRGAAAAGWDQLERRRFPGEQRYLLSAYSPLRPDRYTGLRAASRPVEGAVDSAVEADGTLRVGGWAVMRDSGPAEHLLAYVGDRLVGASVPNVSRPDVAAHTSATTDLMGFVLELPRLDGADAHRLRVLAVDGGTAAPIPRYCSATVRAVLGC